MYVLDKNKQFKAVLSNDMPKGLAFWSDDFEDRLNEAVSFFTFEVDATHVFSRMIENEGYLLYPLDNGFKMLKIKGIEYSRDDASRLMVRCEHIAVSELNTAFPIKNQKFLNYLPEEFLSAVLGGSSWQAGKIEVKGTRTIELDEWCTPLKVVHMIREAYECDLVFRVDYDTTRNKILGKYVDLLVNAGRRTGKTFDVGKSVRGFRRISNTDDTITALVGVGKGDNDESITFSNVLWRKSNGEPADKPLGNEWVGHPEAFQLWNENGEHKWGIYNSQEKEPAAILQDTWERLNELIKMFLNYEVDVNILEKALGYTVKLGDYVYVREMDLEEPLVVEARILQLNRSKSNPTADRAILGEFQDVLTNDSKKIRDIQTLLRKKANSWETLPKKFSPTPPENTNFIWIDTSGNDGPVAISKIFDPESGTWVATSATTANELNAYTKLETDGKYGETKDLVEQWKAPDSTEIDGTSVKTASLDFGKSRGGTLSLGEDGGGELRVWDRNSDLELESIGEVVKEGAKFPRLITEDLIAPNILYTMPIDENLFPDITYYVHNLNGDDSNDGLTTETAVRTVQSILNKLPRYLSGNITIFMLSTGEDQEEDISMTGFGGDGILRIKSESGFKRLAGKITLRHCTNQIIFYQCALKCTETTDIHLKIETCNKVEIRQVKMLGEKKADDGVRAYYSKVTVIDCEAQNYNNSALTSAISNHLTVKNCKGSGNKYGVWAYDGGIVAGGGTAPTGSISQTRENEGHILATFTNDAGPTPETPTTTTVKTAYFKATSSGAWRQNYGGQWYQSVPYQGKWNSWGLYKGLWFFGTQLSFLAGKEVVSMKVKIKRAGSGGSSDDASVVIRAHSYTSQPGGEPGFGGASVTKGFKQTEYQWVDITSLKSAFTSGGAKGIGVYTTSTSNSNYAIFTSYCEVKVTYKE